MNEDKLCERDRKMLRSYTVAISEDIRIRYRRTDKLVDDQRRYRCTLSKENGQALQIAGIA